MFRRSGIGAVGYRAGDAVQLLFHGRGFRAGRVLDFLEERIHFLPEGGRIAVVIGYDIAGFRCRLGSYVGLCPILHGIGHGVLVVSTLFHGAFRIGLRIVANIGNLLADFVGGKNVFADGFVIPGILVTSVFIKRRFRSQLFRTSVKVFGMDFSTGDFRKVIGIHAAGQGPGIEFAVYLQIAANRGIARGRYGCGFNGSDVGQVAALQGGRAIGNAAALDLAGSNHIPVDVGCSVDAGCSINGQATSGDVARHGKAGPRQGSVCVDIAKGRDVARRSYGTTGDGSGRVDVAIGHGRNAIRQGSALYRPGRGHIPGSHVAIGIHGEFAVGAFDAAVRVEGCLGRRGSIAAGIEPVGVLDGAVQAYFNSVFTEGNLVFAALVQYQLGRRFFVPTNFPIGIHAGGNLLQDTVVIEGQSAVHRAVQRRIGCGPSRGFLFIRCLTGVGFFQDFCMQSRIRLLHSGLVGGDIALIGGDIVRIGFNLVAMRVDQLESLVHIGGRGPIPQGDHIIRSGNSRRIDGRRRGCQRGRHPRTHDNSGGQCGHGGFCIPFACVLRDDDIRMPDFTPNDTVRFVHNALLS